MVSTLSYIQHPTKATTLKTNKQAIQNRLIRIELLKVCELHLVYRFSLKALVDWGSKERLKSRVCTL